MRYGPGDRLPDPSWKSGPPDPDPWRDHEHWFEEPSIIESDYEYLYIVYQCYEYDHPHGDIRCDVKKKITYEVSSISGDIVGLDMHLWEVAHEAGMAFENGDVLEVGEVCDDAIEVTVEIHGNEVTVLFEQVERYVG